MVIKPSGIAYEAMTLEDLVVVDLEGKVREGHRKPSSDTATHGAVPRLRRYWRRGAHPQPQRHHLGAGRAADPGAGHHPRRLLLRRHSLHPADERGGDRRRLRGETGKVIIETFNRAGRDPQQVPGVLVYSHGPFARGKDAADAVHNAVVLEEVAIMAMATRQLAPAIAPMQPELLDKHFLRKHGKHAYYGQ